MLIKYNVSQNFLETEICFETVNGVQDAESLPDMVLSKHGIMPVSLSIHDVPFQVERLSDGLEILRFAIRAQCPQIESL